MQYARRAVYQAGIWTSSECSFSQSSHGSKERATSGNRFDGRHRDVLSPRVLMGQRRGKPVATGFDGCFQRAD